jgi:putative (di)nucleoside polyphosphate hydrolase
MPQGGMQPGESPEQAALRELSEELGTQKVVIVDSCPHWLHYDYPNPTSTRRAQMFRGQRHKWFLLRFTGTDGDITVNTRHAEFSTWRWMPPDEVIASVISFKRDIYRAVLGHFSLPLSPPGHTGPIPRFLITPCRQRDDGKDTERTNLVTRPQPPSRRSGDAFAYALADLRESAAVVVQPNRE